MTPEAFIAKWRGSELKERSAAQEHFIDLCRLLDESTPAEADPAGDCYAFERGATKTTGGEGWADVWKRGHFAWEYKSPGKSLTAAYAQLQQYAPALDNPPLLVVCDLVHFEIHTNWTNSVSRVHRIALEDLRDAKRRRLLKWVLSDPEQLRPDRTRQALTEEAAGEFAELAKRLRERGHDPRTVAHFINRLVFCMFAEDVGLLGERMFAKMLEASFARPDRFEEHAASLFAAMRDGGEAVERLARGLAEPARPGRARAGGGAGLSRPPGAGGREGGQGVEEAHPHPPVQRASGLAGPRPPRPRRRRRRRLRLARRHPRRGRPGPPDEAERGTISGGNPLVGTVAP